jgi:hypothetical protein
MEDDPMLKRACLCIFLLAAAACGGKYSTTSPSAAASPVFIAIGPGGAEPFSATFQGHVITAPGSFLFVLPPGQDTYSIAGTFSHGVLEVRFSGGDLGRGGVKSGSVVATLGPNGAVTSPCGIAWSLSGNAATVGREYEVKFTVTEDSSQACQ